MSQKEYAELDSYKPNLAQQQGSSFAEKVLSFKNVGNRGDSNSRHSQKPSLSSYSDYNTSAQEPPAHSMTAYG